MARVASCRSGKAVAYIGVCRRATRSGEGWLPVFVIGVGTRLVQK
jgi:hypothetical protein